MLAGYALGLLAVATSRLLQNTFFALRDTRTPARIAAARLAIDALLGFALMTWLDRYPVAAVFGDTGSGAALYLGAVGLAVAQSVGSWTELALLRRKLRAKVPGLELPVAAIARLLALAVLLALPALGVWALLPAGLAVTWQALAVLPVYVGAYLGVAWWRRSPELALWLGRPGHNRSGDSS